MIAAKDLFIIDEKNILISTQKTDILLEKNVGFYYNI